MDLQLQGRHALVTGSTAGIGLAIARALVREGARVTLNGRHDASVQAALQGLRTEFPAAALRGVAADAGSAAGCETLVTEATRAAPPVDSSSTTLASSTRSRSRPSPTPTGSASSRST
jgi:NAD(P)-dependent dehydrogenase (short-subunit alcohol dehydrogenase family)